jgi:cellulose synthase/poly-beta-1,6-N-acetylglucosamine synthase-like glycosyltransferase
MFLLQYIKKHKGSIFWIESDEAIIQTRGETSIRNFISQRARWAGKSIKLTDRDTRILALVTFLTNIIILALLLLGIFSPELLKQAVGLYILKSIPDFLILHRITGMRSKRTLLWFFIPAQLFYPLYILLVSVIGMVNSGRWRRVKYRAS